MEEAGFSRDQAEASVRILVETMEDKLASKQDLKDLEVALKQDLKNVQVEMSTLKVSLKQDTRDLQAALKQDMTSLEVNVKRSFSDYDFRLQQIESRLTIRMGTMLAASIAIITALQVYVFKLLAPHA